MGPENLTPKIPTLDDLTTDQARRWSAGTLVNRVREMQGSLVNITIPSGTGIYRLIEVHEQAGNMFIEAQPLPKTSDAANALMNEVDPPVKLINMNHVVSLELLGVEKS